MLEEQILKKGPLSPVLSATMRSELKVNAMLTGKKRPED